MVTLLGPAAGSLTRCLWPFHTGTKDSTATARTADIHVTFTRDILSLTLRAGHQHHRQHQHANLTDAGPAPRGLAVDPRCPWYPPWTPVSCSVHLAPVTSAVSLEARSVTVGYTYRAAATLHRGRGHGKRKETWPFTVTGPSTTSVLSRSTGRAGVPEEGPVTIPTAQKPKPQGAQEASPDAVCGEGRVLLPTARRRFLPRCPLPLSMGSGRLGPWGFLQILLVPTLLVAKNTLISWLEMRAPRRRPPGRDQRVLPSGCGLLAERATQGRALPAPVPWPLLRLSGLGPAEPKCPSG